jgi:DNA-binding GntR family transcriptional regulator
MLSRAVDVPLVFQAFRQFDRAQLERSNLFHRLMVDAIEAGDPPRAERLMAEHIDEGRDVLLAAIDARPSFDELFGASAS